MKRSPFPFIIMTVLLAACTTTEAAVPTPTVTAVPATLVPIPTECAQELIPPAFYQTEPSPIVVGKPFRLIGTGGYFRDSCGGVNESARSFAVYLDDQSIGEIVCYVNHCEGTFTIPSETQAGTHCLSTEPGRCDLEIQVTTS